MRRYLVHHVTTYTYEKPVTTSYGWACLTPRSLPDQTCPASEVLVEPVASLTAPQTDFFGNRSTYFEVHAAHTELVVTAASSVEITRVPADLGGLTTRWETARDDVDALAAPERAEATGFRLPSPHLPTNAPVADFAARVLRPGRPLGEALTALVHEINTRFAYVSGATQVSTTLSEVLATKRGVCQDFAHLAVAALRWAGLPARYVSGYLETSPPPGRPRLQGSDASHAWVSVLVPGVGWIDLDPTNDKVVDDSYVVTAWGRDYTDVPPLKGVIFTEGRRSTLKVAVDVLRQD